MDVAVEKYSSKSRTYLLIEEYFSTATSIYTHRTVLTPRELIFAEDCHNTLRGASTMPEKFSRVLNPLQGRDEKTAIDTLSTYLIDSDRNIALAAKYLHVHESTVKYRLNSIKKRLGYDITEMPGVYSLYKALALRRLLQGQKQTKY